MQTTEIEYTRMARTKELMRRRQSRPQEQTMRKRLRTDTLPKRCFYPDGQSRPWQIEELKEVIQ